MAINESWLRKEEKAGERGSPDSLPIVRRKENYIVFGEFTGVWSHRPGSRQTSWPNSWAFGYHLPFSVQEEEFRMWVVKSQPQGGDPALSWWCLCWDTKYKPLYLLLGREEGLPWWMRGKDFACHAGDAGSIPGFGKIPWRKAQQPTPVFLPGESQTEEPGGLQSMRSQRVGHDWSNRAYTHAGM